MALVDAGIEKIPIDQRIAAGIQAQFSDIDIRAQVEGILAERLGSGNVVNVDRDLETESIEDLLVNEALSVVGPVTFGDTLRVGGAVSLDGALHVAGPATFTGSVAMGVLMAQVAEIEESLSVFGDTRVSGDLYLEGALRAHDLFVPGTLRIDGEASIAGILTAERKRAGSGSEITGALMVDGNLLVSGRSVILGSGSILMAQDVVVAKALVILGDITIKGLATFEKNVEVRGELWVNDRQAGYAMIPRGGTGVTVHFGTGFLALPIVTAAPDVPVLYAVSRATQSGFTIRLAAPASEDMTFSWLALLTVSPKTHDAIPLFSENRTSSSSATSVPSEDSSPSSAESSDVVEDGTVSSAAPTPARSPESASSSSEPSSELVEGTGSLAAFPESPASSSSSILSAAESSASSTDDAVESTELPITNNE